MNGFSVVAVGAAVVPPELHPSPNAATNSPATNADTQALPVPRPAIPDLPLPKLVIPDRPVPKLVIPDRPVPKLVIPDRPVPKLVIPSEARDLLLSCGTVTPACPEPLRATAFTPAAVTAELSFFNSSTLSLFYS